MNSAPEHLLFITGRLAESGVRRTVASLADEFGFTYDLVVLPITVAALMTTQWVAKRFQPAGEYDRIILPGYCQGDLTSLSDRWHCRVERGPSDYRRLPSFFGKSSSRSADYGRYDIQIIAEINHAPLQTIDSVVEQALGLQRDGADIIDLGSLPDHDWRTVGDYVQALRERGMRVSIDSLMPREIERAVQAGAELVLSVNRGNREAAADWGCEVVAIPDRPDRFSTLFDTLEYLEKRGVPHRADAILEPIGCGFAQSLHRYHELRQRLPQVEIMMGIGNLTELTDADSAGINVVLLGFCQELGIRSVLTTQVINWARSSVKECDLARRLVFEAVQQQAPPKHLEPRLVLLRDLRLESRTDVELQELAAQIRDHNYRIFAEGETLHLMGGGLHWLGDDPFELFDQLMIQQPSNVDPSHAFYLGYELCKAKTALTLSKEYRQDQALDWGYLTEPEIDRHRLRKKNRSKSSGTSDASE